MNAARGIRSLLPTGLFAVVLLAAQLGAAMHAYDHDFGAPQAKVCKTCIGFDQLASGGVDCPGDGALPVRRSKPARSSISPAHFVPTPAARQRGPPRTQARG